MIIIGIFIGAGVAMADTVDQQLPKTATAQIKASTKQMVSRGFNTDNVINMTQLMLANNFSQQQILQAHAILMNAHQQGLPIEPIMSKAHEGMAKHIQAGNIVQAMEQVRSRYAFASKQARAVTHDKAKINQMATILAGSLAAGMNHEDAGRMMQVLQARAQNMTQTHSDELAMQTLMTARIMSRQGMQSQAVSDSVCQALQQGYNAQEMHNMRNTMMINASHAFSKGMMGGKNSSFGQHGGQSDMDAMSGPGAGMGMGSTGGGSGGGGM